MQSTLVVIKPDGVRRGIVGDIIARFERLGLKIVGMKMLRVDDELLKQHYDKPDEWLAKVGGKLIEFYEQNGKDSREDLGTTEAVEVGKKILGWLFDYVSSGPVVAFVVEGYNAVELVRKHTGSTYPLEAAPGTIRGDYHYDSADLANFGKRAVENIVHSSGSEEEAKFEIGLWFKNDELFSNS